MSHEGERGWCYAAASQGLTKIVGSHQKLRKKEETDTSLQPSEGSGLVYTLISDF